MTTQILPNFIIIGAARSGTSSLYEYLRQHPDIFLSTPKEPMYFAFPEQKVNFSGPGDALQINKKAVTAQDDYLSLFQGSGNCAAVGEASANYLYSTEAAKNIEKLIPDAKLIVVLRNPVERAYSSYLYTLRDGREPLGSFEEALEKEQQRINDNWEHLWHYQAMGFYHQQLLRYTKLFNNDQLKVILQDDLQANTAEVVRETFEFLGVDSSYRPSTDVSYNQGGKPKSITLNRLLTRPSLLKTLLRPITPRFALEAYVKFKHKNLTKPELKRETYNNLLHEYSSDITQLQALINRDLSHWLKERDE
ncbi:sulfotransferase family protein [Teredinibacter waterburyi]|uniref:sulfotransferase family protein n=1 Tax=Teredinibacter waterburyi TaxID=1500538 RepID=UPI00165FB60A|nr:sulfotransferase [Teredinibacter waterburyi]